MAYNGWIIAIDPGVHTGMVLVTPDDQVESVTAMDYPTIERFLHYAYEQSHYQGPLTVIESYAGAGHLMREAITTMEVLGFCHGFMRSRGLPVHFQTPQSRLAFVGRAELVLPGHEQRHMRSALAHAFRAREDYEGE